MTGPLLVGLLAQLYGWHAGFGLAGVLMLAGLATYLAGYRTISEEMHAAKPVIATTALARGNPSLIIAALAVAMALTVFQSIAYYQNSSEGISYWSYLPASGWGNGTL